MTAERSLRWTGAFGLAAGVVYLATTAAGSWLDPGYSQVAQPISDLTATGAPSRALLVAPYALYNLLCLGFAVGLYRASDRGRLAKLGLVLLVSNVLGGLMMVTWFAEDAGGVVRSTAGAGHLLFAALSSLAVVTGSFVFGVGFRRWPGWRRLSGFSMAVGVGFAVLGPLAAVATAQGSRLAGLAERGPIGLYILWLLVLGGHALQVARREAP